MRQMVRRRTRTGVRVGPLTKIKSVGDRFRRRAEPDPFSRHGTRDRSIPAAAAAVAAAAAAPAAAAAAAAAATAVAAATTAAVAAAAAAAVAATAAAPAAAAAAVAATAATPVVARLARAGLIDGQVPTAEILAVQRVGRLVGAIGHLDEPEAFRSVRVAVDDDLRRRTSPNSLNSSTRLSSVVSYVRLPT